ncbi:MAG: response regulator [Deltaproteobacteria bacterium]|nr:response regulator [Deltaproteobacteria bacterium]
MPKKIKNGALFARPPFVGKTQNGILGIDDFLSPIVDSLPDEMIVINRDLSIAWANSKVRKKHAWGVWDTTGLMCYQISHGREDPCNGQEHPCPMREVIHTKAPVVVNHVHRDTQGNKHRVQITASPVFDSNGEVSQIVEVIRHARQEFGKTGKNQKKFAQAFKHNPCLMTISNINTGHFYEANDTFLETLGYTREEIIGKTSVELNLFADVNQRNEIAKAVQTKKSIRDFDVDVKTKSGEVRQGMLSADLVYFDDDPFLLTVMNDITERKLAEEERLKLEVQMQKTLKLESLGNLAGGIAHDFNNLLMGVLGNVELSLLELPPDSSVRERIYDIEIAAKRAADLAKQMLAFSGKGQFLLRQLNLKTLLQETSHLFQPSIPKTTALRLKYEPGLLPIKGDIGQIRQIVINLITNAWEAIGKEQGTITIRAGTIACEKSYFDFWDHSDLPAGTYSYIEVSDNGAGIERAIHNKILDPFFSTKFTGRGLGLAEVLGIVRGHRGAIKFESNPGHGSTFRVFFPSLASPENQPEVAAPSNDAPFRGHTILLVDDEAIIRSVGRAMLEHLGFNVVSARDGEEAIQIFVADPQRFSCALLDLTMPNKDGAQCYRELIQIRDDIPVVLTSGYQEKDLRSRFDKEGFAGFIQKPYQTTTLKNIFLQALEKSNGAAPV